MLTISDWLKGFALRKEALSRRYLRRMEIISEPYVIYYRYEFYYSKYSVTAQNHIKNL